MFPCIRRFNRPHLAPLAALWLAAAALAGCAGRQPIFLAERVSAVRTAAVVYFTVPADVSTYSYVDDYRRAPTQAERAMDNGGQAAALSFQAFLEGIGPQNLPFRVLSFDETTGNAAFQALYAPRDPPPVDPDAGFFDKIFASFDNEWGDLSIVEAAAPARMNEFGLRGWDTLLTHPEERDYVRAAIAALGVDAAIVINDRGYRYSCRMCFSLQGSAPSGEVSTASRAVFALVDGQGTVLIKGRFSFSGSEATAGISFGTVEPEGQDALFAAHGRRMAIAFGEKYRELAAAAGR